ncbi:MAG: sigma-70 family RNA polymerase sigma factor [Ruminiclostridium sp.]|nr:sigma-70 family RNA polymerase sigma factor [Ruminiclostridium sp.]
MRDASETEKAVRLYAGTVYGIALSHTGSKADADDVFQETFLAFHSSAKVFHDDEHIKAWLIRTAVNMSRRAVCGKHRRAEELDENMPGGRFEFAADEQNDIADAIRALPEKYRAVIWLHYFEDMPVKDIAKALGARESTIRSQLMRGRERLKELLGKDWFEDE